MTAIVEIQIQRLLNLLRDRHITLILDDTAKKFLADRGYDPVYGARPLKRIIQTHLQNTLATELLEGTVKEHDTVHVSATESGLKIEVQPAS